MVTLKPANLAEYIIEACKISIFLHAYGNRLPQTDLKKIVVIIRALQYVLMNCGASGGQTKIQKGHPDSVASANAGGAAYYGVIYSVKYKNIL